MTWAKDKDRIMAMILGIMSTAICGAALMIVNHSSALSAHENRIEHNKEQIQRIERSNDRKFEIIDSKLDQIIREMK